MDPREQNSGVGPEPDGAWMYVLRLESGALYIGATRNLTARWSDHLAGRACRTTRLDPPVSILYRERHPDYRAARRREAQLKRWTRGKKEALVAGRIAELKQRARRGPGDQKSDQR